MLESIKKNLVLILFTGLFVFGFIFYFVSNYLFQKKVAQGSNRKTKKGDMVQSGGEQCIANFLYDHDIRYIYDKSMRLYFWQIIPIRPDFYLPDLDIYIEYWGMVGDKNYDSHAVWKKNLYKKAKKKLINLYPNQIKNLNTILKKELGL